MIHSCGHLQYRTIYGKWVCPRCQQQDSLCPAWMGQGFTERRKVMQTCKSCGGTGYLPKTNAPTSGSPSTQTESSTSAASGGMFSESAADCGYAGPTLVSSMTKAKGR